MNKESEDNDTINQQQWWPGVTHRPGPYICSLIKIWLHKMSSVLMRSLSSPTRRYSTHLHSRRLISHLHNCHNRVHTRKSGSRNHLSNNDTVNTKFLIFFFFLFFTQNLSDTMGQYLACWLLCSPSLYCYRSECMLLVVNWADFWMVGLLLVIILAKMIFFSSANYVL